MKVRSSNPQGFLLIFIVSQNQFPHFSVHAIFFFCREANRGQFWCFSQTFCFCQGQVLRARANGETFLKQHPCPILPHWYEPSCRSTVRTLRTVNSSIRTVCEVNGPNGPSSRFLASSEWDWNFLSPTSEMQFTVPQLIFYGPYSRLTVRTICMDRELDFSLSEWKWNILSPTNCTDRNRSLMDRYDAVNTGWTNSIHSINDRLFDRRPKQRMRAEHILTCSMFRIYYQIGKIYMSLYGNWIIWRNLNSFVTPLVSAILSATSVHQVYVCGSTAFASSEKREGRV